MIFPEFQDKIKKLDPEFRIETNHRVDGYHPDFNYTGLYHKGKYITPVPLNDVPEHSIVGVDIDAMQDSGLTPLPLGKFYDPDYIEDIRKTKPGAIKERFLARGYRSILAKLSAFNLIDTDRSKVVFDITPERNRQNFPKRYLSCHIKTHEDIPEDDLERYFWQKPDIPKYFI